MPAEGGEPLDTYPPTPAFDAVVLANGAALPSALLPDLAGALDAATLRVAADGGIDHAHRAAREVDVLVGDLDSVSPRALSRARDAGTELLEHPTDKDATDLDLALLLVGERLGGGTPVRTLVVGGHGGRLDHLLANLLILGAERHAGLCITAWLGTDVVQVVRDVAQLNGTPGAPVSLLALHGEATGVTTDGLRFPLGDATLAPGSSLGVSNVFTGDRASVRVRSGVLVTVQPSHP